MEVSRLSIVAIPRRVRVDLAGDPADRGVSAVTGWQPEVSEAGHSFAVHGVELAVDAIYAD